MSVLYLNFFYEKHLAHRPAATMADLTAVVREHLAAKGDAAASWADSMASEDVWADKTGDWEVAKAKQQRLFFVSYVSQSPALLTVTALRQYCERFCRERGALMRDLFVALARRPIPTCGAGACIAAARRQRSPAPARRPRSLAQPRQTGTPATAATR